MAPPPRNRPPEKPRPASGAAGPDAIWAPWRLQYLESIDDTPPGSDDARRSDARAEPEPHAGCFLDQYWRDPGSDAANNVIHRTETGMILLNGFPYANGHLLVALGEPRPRLLEYSPAQRADLWSLVDLAMDLIERTLEPQGVNVGINQGRAAGAGVPGHLHVHLVPRWGGDINFMTTVGQIRVIPSSLEAMAERFRATLASMNR